MAFNFDVSILNPIRLFQLSDDTGVIGQNISYATFDANYQTRPFDADFFARNIPKYDRQTTYCQPFQQGDVLRIQFLGLENDNFVNQYLLNIIDVDGKSVLTASPTQGATPIGGQYITEFSVPLSQVAEGEYFVSIRYRKFAGSYTYTYLISEPISIAQSHPNTLLYEYSNSYNTQGIIFEELSAPFQFRVHSAMTELNPDAKFTTYEDEPLNLELLSGTPYRLWTLGIGGAGNPIPEWIADKIDRLTLCDTLKIDGKLYTRNEGAKIEANRKQRTPLFSWKLTLREKINDNNLYINDYQQNKVITADVVEGTGTIYARELVTATDTYGIANFFNGYTGLLQYLNGQFKINEGFGGTFGIDANNQLVYTPSSTAEATEFATASLKILPYTLEFGIDATSGTSFRLGLTPQATTNYAVQYVEGGTITFNITTTTANLTNTYTAGQKAKARVAVDSVQDYELLTATTCTITEVGGYLANDTESVDFGGELVSNFTNNIFQFLGSGFTLLDLSTTSLTQVDIDNILKWFYLNEKVGSPTLNLLQTPDVPCSEQVRTNIVPYLLGRGFILYINNQFTPAPPVNVVAPSITGTFQPANTITCNTGTWTGYPTPYFTFNWQYSTNGGTTWNNFSPLQVGSTYLVQSIDVGRLIRCQVVATNPSGTTPSVTSGILITGTGSAPALTVAPVVTGATLVGSVLTTTNGTWSGTAPITYTYQWLRNGVAISLATSSTYTSVSADAGQNIQCQVIATNTSGVNTGESNVLVPTIAPTNTALPTISGTTALGATLTANNGTWAGFPAPTFTYNWQRSTNGGVSYSNLGVTTQTYTLVSGDLGNLIRVQVTANNGISPNATANSAGLSIPTATTQRPENTVAPAITGNPYIGQVLTVSNGTWNNTPTGYSYQWKRGTTNIGTNSSTYTLVSADVDQTITCIVTATNAGGNEPQVSNSIYAYDADFYAVVNYANANSITLPSTKQLQFFSTIVTELKGLGFWTLHDIFYVTYNDSISGQAFARINWRNPSLYYLNPVSAPTWTTNAGYTLNGTTQYLDTGFNPATNGVAYTLNDASRFMWFQRGSNASVLLDGNLIVNDNSMRSTSSSQSNTINSGTTLPAATNTIEGGFHGIVRTNSTTAYRVSDLTSTITSVNVASSAITSLSQWIGRGATTYLPSSFPIRFYSMGGAIQTADVFDFRRIINKLVNL